MKDYLIPIAIIIGAIILSATAYMAITSHDRKTVKLCIKYVNEPNASFERKKRYCLQQVYDYRK